MGLEYAVDVLAALKDAGYSTDKLRQKKYLSESVIQHIRRGEQISWASIERICSLLNAQPGEILLYNGSPSNKKIKDAADRKQRDREFEYLWEIWDTRFRKPGESMADFHPVDFERYLPVPDDWKGRGW